LKEYETTETQADILRNNGYTDAPELKLICMEDVQQEDVTWLWKPYIPFGKITIIQGDPASGKTFLGIQIAAIATTGGEFPNEV